MKDNLLKEQLAESGLEMQVDLFTGIVGGIGALTGIIGGVSGASEAAAQNRKAEEAQKKQQKLLDKQAKLQNEYNAKKFKVEKENYYKQAQYNFDTAIQSWQYQTTVRALEEKVDAQKYLMNVQNSQRQLTFNEIAAQQASSREQLATNDAMSEYRFQAQDQLVAQLQAQGQARLGQAGRSLSKREQGVQAQIGRDLAVISASLSGEIAASNLRMFDINLGRYSADAAVEAARMLRPERLPDGGAPTRPPEPVWLEPMKILPGMAAPAQTQSVFAPLIAGSAAAASSLSKIDWNTTKTGNEAFLAELGRAGQGLSLNPLSR
jgi:hypothetical protein